MKKLFYIAVVAIAAVACSKNSPEDKPLEITWNFLGMEVERNDYCDGNPDLFDEDELSCYEKDTSFFIDKSQFTTDAYIKLKGDSLYYCIPTSLNTSRLSSYSCKIVNDTIYTYSFYAKKYVRTYFTVKDATIHKLMDEIVIIADDYTLFFGYFHFKQ
jgi:hypothetical protein